MKRVLIFAFALLVISPVFMAWKKTPPPPPEAEGIHWITSIDELQAKMQQNPKKVYFDVYTGWCGWCKKMDATTFQNPSLIKYMNTNFYAVKLDAERQDVIHFLGKEYKFEPTYKANTFAAELLKGNLSYPTAVIMMENFQNPQIHAGYMDVNQLETILTYFGDNVYRHQNGQEYQKTYKPTWSNGQASDMTPPPGH
jgi:thioredoxin-related protein